MRTVKLAKRTIVFDRAQLALLDRLAVKEGRSRSNLVRHLLARELARYEERVELERDAR